MDSEVHHSAAVPRVAASTVAALVSFALSKGLTLDEIERRSGISAADVVDPESRIPDTAVEQLWRALERRCPKDLLPVEMARAASLSFFSGLAHGMQFARNLEEALKLMVKNRALLSDRVVMKLSKQGGEAIVEVYHPQDMATDGRLNMTAMLLAVRLIRERLEAGHCLKRLEFAYPARGERRALEAELDLPIRFTDTRTGLVFHRKCLSEPLKYGNLELFAHVDRHFRELRERVSGRGYPGLLGQLRQAAIEAVAVGDYSVTGLANRARLSLRSAQRIASDQGLTLRQLIEEVREDTAKEFLSTSSLDLATIASLVGYSDDRAFRRAFKRWTGRSPSTYRAAMRDR
ncbi:MAG: AraC family transcriptional regulator ligand-binding domain-containing protein [Pseudomonadota bacterium]